MDSWSCRGNRGIPIRKHGISQEEKNGEKEAEREIWRDISLSAPFPTAHSCQNGKRQSEARYARLDHTQQLSTHPSYDVNWSLVSPIFFVVPVSSLLFSHNTSFTALLLYISRLFLNVRYYISACVCVYYWTSSSSPAALSSTPPTDSGPLWNETTTRQVKRETERRPGFFKWTGRMMEWCCQGNK